VGFLFVRPGLLPACVCGIDGSCGAGYGLNRAGYLDFV
jgi:hypothetical protein